MPTSLLRTVGVPAINLLGDEGSDVRQCGQKSNFQIALAGEALKNSGQPEGDAIAARHGAEIAKSKQDDITMAQRLPDAVRALTVLGFLLLLQVRSNPGFFVFWQPAGLFGPIGEIPDRDDPEQNSRNTL